MNLDQALRSLEDRVVVPDAPDVVGAVLADITAGARPAWWRRPRVLAAAAAAAVVALVVGLIPAAREEVASWFGIGGVTIETVAPTTASATSTPATTARPTTVEEAVVQSGLGEGLALGMEVVSLTVESLAGFRPLYPELGLPDREFVDFGGRAWLLYGAYRGLPELDQVPAVGMIVTQFQAESPGIVKQIAPGGSEFVDFGDGLFGLWVPGPHELVLPDADGSAVGGRSAGNTLLWEQDGLTIRIETALTKAEAVAIAETFS